MTYLTERSLLYYFLMREITDGGIEIWRKVANVFGVDQKSIKRFEDILKEQILDELLTADDIEVYKNYISCFIGENKCFGKSADEAKVLETKAVALQKVQEICGNGKNKAERLRIIAYFYENDHTASILYALQIMWVNADEKRQKYAEKILMKEFKYGQNSDAGFILLRLKHEDKGGIVSCLKSLPDMFLRPDIIKYLTDKYGGSEEIVINNKLSIGF